MDPTPPPGSLFCSEGLLIHASSGISSVAKHHRKSHPPYLVLFSTHLVYITRLIQYQILLYRIVTTIWFRTIPLICARLAEKACGKMAESRERDTLARKMSGSQACQNVLITWEINNSDWKLLLKLSALHTLNSGLSISRLKTLRYQRERLWQRFPHEFVCGVIRPLKWISSSSDKSQTELS